MVPKKIFAAAGALAVAASLLPSGTAGAATTTRLATQVAGATAGSRVLAVYSTGASTSATLRGGKATLVLPKAKSSKVKVSLHLVGPNGAYAGPISLGKKSGKKTTWNGAVVAARGKTTKLPKITYNASQGYGSATLTGTAAKIALATALRGASVKGKPAGAGRLGMATTKKASSASLAPGDWIEDDFTVRAFDAADVDAGGDLDGDGLPNTLDIDDDGDGYPDQVDQSAGLGGSTPTAKYDTINALNTAMTWRQPPINYNYLVKLYPDPAKLRTELSKLNSDGFTMTARVVAPFLSETSGVTIRDAWVDCTGLPWCVSEDSGTTEADLVVAPRMLPWGDGDIGNFWKYAYKKADQTTCSIYNPASNSTGTPGCQVVKWGSYSMKDMLTKAVANGMPSLTAPTWEDHTGGFGMNDAYYLKPPGSGGGSGFDFTAYFAPRGYAKFLDNMKVGDVFTVKATLSDGSTAQVAMTISPFFVTAPTAFSFTAQGGTEKTVDYTVSDTTCTSNDGPTCRNGSDNKPIEVSAAQPKLTVKFWRPQRPRITGADDAISGTDTFLDMGSLNYRFALQGNDGGQFVFCPNAAVSLTDTNGSTFTPVAATSGFSNDREFIKDGSSEAPPSETRFITAVIDLAKCPNLAMTAGTKYTVTMYASGEPLFGMNRSSTSQSFAIRFAS